MENGKEMKKTLQVKSNQNIQITDAKYAYTYIYSRRYINII